MSRLQKSIKKNESLQKQVKTERFDNLIIQSRPQTSNLLSTKIDG